MPIAIVTTANPGGRARWPVSWGHCRQGGGDEAEAQQLTQRRDPPGSGCLASQGRPTAQEKRGRGNVRHSNDSTWVCSALSLPVSLPIAMPLAKLQTQGRLVQPPMRRLAQAEAVPAGAGPARSSYSRF